MPSPEEELLSAFDGHNADAVRAALERGADAVTPIRGKFPVNWLLEEYARSDRLGECLRLLSEHGAVLDDPILAPVLADDAESLRLALRRSPNLIRHRTSLRSAFVSLEGVTLLHVAAEYGNANAARVLIEAGADVDAQADQDSDGLNGHTPIFHTVNSNANRAEPIMRMLLDAGASTRLLLEGLVWGRGYQWETTFFDVTPISFAQMGLMPQVHRSETEIYANIRLMLESSSRKVPSLGNVPNAYLRPKNRG